MRRMKSRACTPSQEVLVVKQALALDHGRGGARTGSGSVTLASPMGDDPTRPPPPRPTVPRPSSDIARREERARSAPPPLIQSTSTPGVPFRPSAAPIASPLGFEEERGTKPAVSPRRGELATSPLRPIARVSVPRLLITIERENGQQVGRSVTHEGE